jgi:hypothetical protein
LDHQVWVGPDLLQIFFNAASNLFLWVSSQMFDKMLHPWIALEFCTFGTEGGKLVEGKNGGTEEKRKLDPGVELVESRMLSDAEAWKSEKSRDQTKASCLPTKRADHYTDSVGEPNKTWIALTSG